MSNNINTPEIEKFVKLIKSNPKEAKKAKRVEGEWIFKEGNPQFKSNLTFQKSQITLECELPPFAGGWGGAPDPVQYCLYGLAACYATTFASSATMEGIILDELRVIIESNLDLRKQMGVSEENIIEKMKFTVIVKSKASREKLQTIKELADKRCPGMECLTRPITVSTELA